ncbi:MAG: hypothetical protein MI867_16465, partial [Pseudomonadales bacterium]|nr:hypothetical protein [Pseudomonadales bacterium]
RREARPTSINSGASAGVDFPNTNPEVYNVDVDDETDPRDCAPGSGETMAEVYVRTDASRANISPDLVFDDVWTDPAQRTPDTSFAHRYSDIEAVYEAGETNGDEDTGVLPYNRGACADEWDSYCRIVINYEDHIQPLWEVTRTVTTDDGPVNYKCIDCHGAVDPDDGSDQIPAGQLTLTNELDNQDRYASFGEVISNNDIAVVDDGDGNPVTLSGSAVDEDNNVISELVRQGDGTYCYRLADNSLVVAVTQNQTEEVRDPETGEILLDEDNNPITQDVLDDDGFPLPASYTVPEGNLGYNIRLQRGIRSRSNNFRAIFDPGFEYGGSTVCGVTRNARALDFDHSQDGVFSESELKLLWDWLGAGSAYFNNPFAVPD